MYVFDTSVISALHKNYFRSRFVTLWKQFDSLVEEGQLTSTREALRELEDLGGDGYEWAEKNFGLFVTPNAAEARVVTDIYRVTQFRHNIEQKKLLNGGKNADPFLIARASTISGAVVTMEKFKPNGAKIPNICNHFGVPCFGLEEFMEKEGWVF